MTNGAASTASSAAPTAGLGVPHPLVTEAVPIDGICVGDRWSATDVEQLARLIAVIAMGQAAYAAYVLRELLPATPAFTDDDLRLEAKVRLTVQEDGKKPRTGYPQWQRDGFMFEAISWIAARQAHGAQAFLKDPHISSTSQGLDGLMIELSDDKASVTRTTLFEDKCSDDPRAMFLNKVVPALLDRHGTRRHAEVVAAASVLLRIAGIEDRTAAMLASAVMDRSRRRYRAAFALTTAYDSQDARQKLFAGYDAVDGLTADQRIGASLIVDGPLREWFEALAVRAVNYLDTLGQGGA